MSKSPKNAANYMERKIAAMYGKTDVWQNRAARLLVILLLCVQPLFFTRDRYIRLTQHKFEFFCVCMAAVILFALIIWLYRITRKPRLLLQEQPSLADWAILGFATVTVLSALFSPFKDQINVWIGKPEPDGRFDGAVTQLLYVVIFLIISRWYKPRTRDFAVFGISASLVGIIGVLQFYGMDFLKLWPNDMDNYHVENFYNIFFRSTLGNVDIVSTYVCVAILLCGFLFIRMKSKWLPLWLAASALNFWLMELAGADSGRIGLLAAMFLAIPFIVENLKTLGKTLILGASWLTVYTLQKLFYDALILKTRSVSSLALYACVIVVLIAGGVALMWAGRKRERARSREPRFANAGTSSGGDENVKGKWLRGVIVIAVLVVAAVAGVEVLGGRAARSENPAGIIYEAREILHGNLTDEMGTNRVYIWRNALKAYPDRPIIGSGPDTFYFTFPAEAQMRYGQSYDKAHNEYIQILICQGVLGLLCYLLFLVSASIKSIPKAFQNPLVMAVLAAFTGYLVQAFFNISLPIASQMLWVLAGMLANKRFREASLKELG